MVCTLYAICKDFSLLARIHNLIAYKLTLTQNLVLSQSLSLIRVPLAATSVWIICP